jgi:glycosyltransferase involved in cell wall biosynthesis
MRFSVVIPTRNSEKILETTLASLQQQTYSPHEIIVADGRSTDATRQIASHFNAFVVDNPAVHAAGGRNRGAVVASGDWLAFIDSDCWAPPDWLSTAARLITENPDVVVLGGLLRALPPVNEIEQVAGDALLKGVLQYPQEQQRISLRSLRGAFIGANVFYRKDVFFALGGFDERFANFGEDIDLFWRAVATFPGRLLYDPQLYVSQHFPATWSSLFRKWCQYGMASCYLQRYHLGRWRIDLTHYRRLGTAIYALVTQPDQRRINLARLVQIIGHLFGKYWGSVRLGVMNL